MEWFISNKLFLVFSFFSIIFLGIAAGKFTVKGINFGTSMVIFVSIVFGMLGVHFPPFVLQLGIVIFIFSVGIQAGPSFFETVKSEGKLLIATTGVLILVAFTTLWLSGLMFNVDTSYLFGVLTGALTSTPGLAAAVESSESANVIFGYTIAYPFGVIGVILFVRFLPKLFSTTIEEEESLFLKSSIKKSRLHARCFKITNQNIDNLTLEALSDLANLEISISRHCHDGKTIVPSSTSILHINDVIKVVGSRESLTKVELIVGPPIESATELSKNYTVKQVVITNRNVVGKTVRQLNLVSNYIARITRLQRNGVDFFPHAKMKMRYGDKLMIAFPIEYEKDLVKLLGEKVNTLSDDFMVLSLGIILGVALGSLTIPVWGNVGVSLGLSGGVLFSSILLGHLGKVGPLLCHVSTNTNKVLRELGIILFFIGVGTRAGSNLSGIDLGMGLRAFGVGIFVTIIPMLVVSFGLRKIFKVNLVKIVGIIAGGMTSTPALASITSQMKTDFSTVYYAAVYPFALVFLILTIKISALLAA